MPGSMFADYQRTIQEFLARYDTKTTLQKKGIIGELLTHVLARHYLEGLEPASILFNKEERSMRKGFDLIFLEPEHETIWYSEVKSGHAQGTVTPSEKCLYLLKTARADITDKFTNAPINAWFSAVVDANLTVSEYIRPVLQRLLDADARARRPDSFSAAAMLVSVVYASPASVVDYDEIIEYFDDTYKEELLSNLIVLSIQKETVERVVNFLRNEI